LWGISNKNTLYTAAKRYVQRGILIPVYKGLYSTVPLTQLNPLELGVAIVHKYTYLSLESILAQAGIIYQSTYSYTFVSSVSKKLIVGGISFQYRKLKDEFLNNTSGITNQDGIFTASVERAVADMLYFNPNYHFDLPDNIDWEKVNKIQKEVYYQ
jgi:predicted transcriptional regulator of viral defense system